MDFFTIDTLLNQRFYVFFMIYHKTREIIQFAVTRNPTREFVRQQLIEFMQRLDHVVYFIHDYAAQFNMNYFDYGINGIKTSVKAPNMNSTAEWFIGSVKKSYWIILLSSIRISYIICWRRILSIIIQKDRIKVLSREFRKVILLEILDELNLSWRRPNWRGGIETFFALSVTRQNKVPIIK